MTVTQTLIETHRARITSLVEQGALFVVNHSGGKDSQATYAIINELVPDHLIEIVHCDLGEVEWHGTLDHVKANVHDKPVHVTRAVWSDVHPSGKANSAKWNRDDDGRGKRLLDMVENRGKWPAGPQRFCTSDFKSGPANVVINRLLEERSDNHRTVVSCFGYRREESDRRAKKEIWMATKNVKGRQWFDFSPILDITTQEVFEVIEQAGQQPHQCYLDGNERMSCVFCIFGSQNDLHNGAVARPELFEKYVALETSMGFKWTKDETLEEVAGITVEEAWSAALANKAA